MKVQNQTTKFQLPEILWPLYSTHAIQVRTVVQYNKNPTFFVSNITGGKMYKWSAFIFYYTLYSTLKILQKIASSLNLIHTSIQREKSPWFKAVLKQCSRGSAWTGTLSSLLSYWNDFQNVKWVTPRRCPRMERHMSVWHFQNGFIRNVS